MLDRPIVALTEVLSFSERRRQKRKRAESAHCLHFKASIGARKRELA